MKKILVLVVAMLVLVGCKSQPATSFLDELVDKNQIIMATSPDYPPFESKDTNNQIVGFDIEMMEEVMRILNSNNNTDLKLVLEPMDFELILTAINMKQADVGVSAFTYDKDRQVGFSETYVVSRQVVIVAANSNIKTIADLDDKKIAVGMGTTGESAIEDQIPTAVIDNTGDYPLRFEALEQGLVDAVVCDEAVGDNYVANRGFVKLETALIDEEMKAIVHSDHSLLLAELNKAIAEFIATEKYFELKEKWGV